jgi:hypothetical protein
MRTFAFMACARHLHWIVVCYCGCMLIMMIFCRCLRQLLLSAIAEVVNTWYPGYRNDTVVKPRPHAVVAIVQLYIHLTATIPRRESFKLDESTIDTLAYYKGIKD